MIDGNDNEGYTLYCDHCGDDCDELFDTFQDAVDYKVDRDNGWASVKDKDDEWQELCPVCNTPEIIAKLKGKEIPAQDEKSSRLASELADIATDDSERL
jgi:hypothetical protein